MINEPVTNNQPRNNPSNFNDVKNATINKIGRTHIAPIVKGKYSFFI
jgi:hypothetical protein